MGHEGMAEATRRDDEMDAVRPWGCSSMNSSSAFKLLGGGETALPLRLVLSASFSTST